jgi:predicted ATPase
MVAMIRNCRREFAEAVRCADAASEVSREHGLSQWLAMGMLHGGFALAGLGKRRRGLEQIREGLSAWHAIGARLFDTQWLGYMAAVHLEAGQLDRALAVLDEAAAALTTTSQTFYQAELLRLRGETLMRVGRVGECEASLTEALDFARSQNAKSLELRAAASLARLWGDQGKRQQAIDLLVPVYGWFTEGFDTADLKDAKALLDELA